MSVPLDVIFYVSDLIKYKNWGIYKKEQKDKVVA